MNPSCVPFSGEISGSTAHIIPIPMNDTRDPSSASAAPNRVRQVDADERGDDEEEDPGAHQPVDHREDAHADQVVGRESGAMNVYSIVPSQRSQATVSVTNSKMIPRNAQMTPPTSSFVSS